MFVLCRRESSGSRYGTAQSRSVSNKNMSASTCDGADRRARPDQCDQCDDLPQKKKRDKKEKKNKKFVSFRITYFLPRDALVHSAVLRLHVVRLSVRLSVCHVGGSGSHRLEILETNCTIN